MTDPKRPYKTISRTTWNKMLRVGRALDLNKGGLFDARSAVVNIWVSPEDHPASWKDIEITQGALEHPRAYLGAVSPNFDDKTWGESPDGPIPLELSATPYDRWQRAEVQHRLHYNDGIEVPYVCRCAVCGPLTYKDRIEHRDTRVHAIEPDEWAWLEAKANMLLDIAERELPAPSGIYCKLCSGYIPVRLLNDFLTHVTEGHQVQVHSLLLGDPTVMQTSIGPWEVS